MNHICRQEMLEKSGVDYPNLCYLFRLRNTAKVDEYEILCVDCGELLFRVKEVRP